MKLVSKKPTIEMTSEEFQTICCFLKNLNDEVFEEFGWSDLIEEVPFRSDCNEDFIKGYVYDIKIVD